RADRAAAVVTLIPAYPLARVVTVPALHRLPDLAVVEDAWRRGPDHQRIVGGEPVDVLDGDRVPDLPRDVDRPHVYTGPSAGLDARHQILELGQEILGRVRLNRPRPKIPKTGLQVCELVAPAVERIT